MSGENSISDSFDTTPPSHTTGASHATHHGDVSHGGIANYGNQNFSGRARIVNNFWRPLVGPSLDDLKKIIETQTEWSTLLGQLSVVDQDQYRSEISQLDRNEPNFYWVTRNMDFEKWESDDSVQVLWLSGPPNRGMTEVSSHAINLAKESAPEANGPVLHFLCSAGARFGGSRSMTTLFTHTVLHQIVCYSSAEKSKSITTIFLNTLLEGHFRRRDAPRFDKNDSVDTTMQKILDASDDDNFRALTAAFWEADIQELSVIIDGIEGGRFVQNVYLLIRHMMEATSATRKFKALLTCLPVSDLRDILGGMLYIEYDKERNECLRFLRHDGTRYGKVTKEHKGSLEWLWKHEKYQKWSTSPSSSLLCIEGKPGSGKSTLMKYFKENIEAKIPDVSSGIVAHYFYTYRGTELEYTHANMLRSILHTILEQEDSVFFHFQSAYRKAQKDKCTEWPYDSLKDILSSLGKHTSTTRRPLYLILDALDESEEHDRRDIINLLFDLCSGEGSCHVKVFLASRPVADLKYRIRECHHVITMQDENKEDISKFVDEFLSTDIRLTGRILRDAREYIIANAQGAFVWVRLIKDELLTDVETGCSDKQIMDHLRGLPKELEEFYQLMFTRLQLTSRNRRPVDIQDGMKILRFALFGFRAITMDELRHVLAIPNVSDPPSIPSYEEFTTNEITNVEEIIKRITHCGGGFVEINADRTVQLMHQTVREFFLRLMVNPDEKPMGFPRSSQEAHKMMATTCIQYLMLCFMNPLMQSRFSGNKTWDSNDFQDYVEYLGGWPLFNYTLRYLKDHKELCDQNEQIPQLISLLVNELMDNQASYFLGDWLESHLRKIDPVRQQPRARGSSNFGQEFLLKTTGTIQLANPAPVYQRPPNVEDFKFRTINAAATADGLSGVAEALLLSCTEVDGHVKGKTPLIISARMGLEATIRLVARGIRTTADMNARDDSGNTALHHAVKGRHEATVKLLIELDVDRNITNNKGWTALRLAIEMFPRDDRCVDAKLKFPWLQLVITR